MSETKEWYSLEELLGMCHSQTERNGWHKKFIEANSYMGRLRALREYYREYHSEIMSYHSSGKRGWFNSYPVDWFSIFTPIEQEAWCSIRCKGKIILYPQYPALKYYLDFGNPHLKIGLEVDGKKFHSQERDFIRDLELTSAGWTIYRIPGSEMMNKRYKCLSDFDEEELNSNYTDNYDGAWHQIAHWLTKTGDGVIESIKRVHFDNVENDYPELLGLCYKSLEDHKLIKN